MTPCQGRFASLPITKIACSTFGIVISRVLLLMHPPPLAIYFSSELKGIKADLMILKVPLP